MIKTNKLSKGDLILLRPKEVYRKLWNIPARIIAKVNKGFTHVAIYAGRGIVIHCDYKVGVIKEHIKDFIKKRKDYYKKIEYRIVRPKYYGKTLGNVFIKTNTYLMRKVGYSVKHLLRMLFFIFKGVEDAVEPIVFDSFAVCSTFIARVLKEANVNIGRKASIAFMPVDFINQKYFEVKR